MLKKPNAGLAILCMEKSLTHKKKSINVEKYDFVDEKKQNKCKKS